MLVSGIKLSSGAARQSQTVRLIWKRSMIVPEFWAEACKNTKHQGKSITVRRFGWSDESESDARRMAEERAEEGLAQIVSGRRVLRREPKVAYNGAEGVPIREEVLSKHGPEVITRNSYGAHCLNTPRALFADIDFTSEPPFRVQLIVWGLLSAVAVVMGIVEVNWKVSASLLVVAAIVSSPLARLLHNAFVGLRGGPSQIAHRRIKAFFDKHKNWAGRVYETPNGLRLLVTHRPFSPAALEVDDLFTSIGTDPLYAKMCRNQRCFRARLTPKPWRIGVASHMKPRPGVWPVRPERLAQRAKWVEEYETMANKFAACRFLYTLGTATVHSELAGVVRLHDDQTKANQKGMTIA